MKKIFTALVILCPVLSFSQTLKKELSDIGTETLFAMQNAVLNKPSDLTMDINYFLEHDSMISYLPNQTKSIVFKKSIYPFIKGVLSRYPYNGTKFVFSPFQVIKDQSKSVFLINGIISPDVYNTNVMSQDDMLRSVILNITTPLIYSIKGSDMPGISNFCFGHAIVKRDFRKQFQTDNIYECLYIIFSSSNLLRFFNGDITSSSLIGSASKYLVSKDGLQKIELN